MAKPGGKVPENVVHSQAIYTETIKKELRNQGLYTKFSINPYKPTHPVTGKPNSLRDAALDAETADTLMMDIIMHHSMPPTKKYDKPVTSSQEYGWMTEPLLHLDRDDMRLYHPKRQTDVTKPKEAEWRLNEQTKNMS